jgi:hypothetical protein
MGSAALRVDRSGRPGAGAAPVRSFHFAKGSRSYPGLYWSATVNRHEGYESWLERDHLRLLDFDRRIGGVSSQPFRMTWLQGGVVRRHTPDFLRPWCRRHRDRDRRAGR